MNLLFVVYENVYLLRLKEKGNMLKVQLRLRVSESVILQFIVLGIKHAHMHYSSYENKDALDLKLGTAIVASCCHRNHWKT